MRLNRATMKSLILPALAALVFATAEARDENSFKTTHYLFEPVGLLPGQGLRVCTADADRTANRKQSLYFPEDMLAEIRVYDGIDAAAIFQSAVQSIDPGALGTCFDVGEDALARPDGLIPGSVLVELVVSAPAESKAVPVATLELRGAAGATRGPLITPALTAEAPVTRGKFGNYRPQFYLRTTDLSPAYAHLFGPFTLSASQEVEVCVSDAGKLPFDDPAPGAVPVTWTAEVHEIGGTVPPLIIVAEDVEAEPLGVCFEGIDLAELALGGPDTTPTGSATLLVFLYANAPPESPFVPMATGRLKPIILDEPEPIALLLPAVQTPRRPLPPLN